MSNTAEKLQLLIRNCRAGVTLRVNNHRSICQTAARALDEQKDWLCPPEIEDSVRAKMIETNTIIEIHFYPRGSVSFYEIFHHDLDTLLDEAIACLREDFASHPKIEIV